MRSIAFCLILALLILPLPAEVTTNMSIPVAITAFVPCAARGSGETVTLTGNLHVLVTLTVNANHIEASSQFQPQGISGIGSVTGEKYQGSGVTRSSFSADVAGFPVSFTSVNNFRIIGQSTGNNLLVHENFHLTINADGSVTAFMDNFSISCQASRLNLERFRSMARSASATRALSPVLE
jgi:hypothetical protein